MVRWTTLLIAASCYYFPQTLPFGWQNIPCPSFAIRVAGLVDLYVGLNEVRFLLSGSYIIVDTAEEILAKRTWVIMYL